MSKISHKNTPKASNNKQLLLMNENLYNELLPKTDKAESENRPFRSARNGSVDSYISKILVDQKYVIKEYSKRFKVPHCTYITKEILPEIYICTCSLDKLFIICSKCKDVCHSDEGHYLYKIDNSNLNLTCNCGEYNHPIRQANNVSIESQCINSKLLDYTDQRLFIKTDESDYTCGFCYLSGLLPNTNIIDFNFDTAEDTYERYNCILEQEEIKCSCKNSIPLPIQALLTFTKLVYGLKEGNSFIKLFLLENNINLIKKSHDVLNVFENVFNDIKNFSEDINKKDNGELVFTEDNDLLKVYTSVFSILASEQNFSYIKVEDIFAEITLDDKIKIIKYLLDAFSIKNLDEEEDEEDEAKTEKKLTQTVKEVINEYFFTAYQFYIYIRNFYFKYNINFSIFTILNMHIYQKHYYLKNSLSFPLSYLTKEALPEYEKDLKNIKLALEFIPEALIDWYDKIINAGLNTFFDEENHIYHHFLKIFVFLTRFDLLTPPIRIRLYNTITDLLVMNIAKSKSASSDTKFIKVFRIDRIFEIIFYGLCYYNDRIVFERFEGLNDGEFVFKNKQNSEEKTVLSRMLTYGLENLDLLLSQRKYVKDTRYYINVTKINCIVKKIFDLFIGNSITQESESYLLSIANLARFNFKISDDYHESAVDIQKDSNFITLCSKLAKINDDFFKFDIKIKDYISSLESILENDAKFIIFKYFQSADGITSNQGTTQNIKVDKEKNTSKDKDKVKLKVLQDSFRSSNFLQLLKQLLFIINKAVNFYQERILKKDNLKILMDLILLCIKGDYENLLLISDCNYLHFFQVFKDIGLKDFLVQTSTYFFGKIYQFDNYFFISNVIILYLYYIDPNDQLTFDNYYDNFTKYEVLQDINNYKYNLIMASYDDLYEKNILYKRLTKDDRNFEKRIHNEEEVYFENYSLSQAFKNLEYSSIKNKDDEWIIQIAMVSRFFPFLVAIIESKDFTFEENLRIFELMDNKLENLVRFSGKIFEVVINPNSNETCKGLLEEFLMNYYYFINMLFRKQIYQLDLVKDSIRFFPEKELEEYDTITHDYLTDILHIKDELANQMLIYLSFYKTNFFIEILGDNSKEDGGEDESNKIVSNLVNEHADSFNALDGPEVSKNRKNIMKSPNKKRMAYIPKEADKAMINEHKQIKFDKDIKDDLDYYEDIKVLYKGSKAVNIISNYEVYKSENAKLYTKIKIATILRSYIVLDSEVDEEGNPVKLLKKEIVKMKDFVLNQLISYDKTDLHERFKNCCIYENFELTILKPFTYFSNILKEAKEYIGGIYNYDYFKIICYLLKVTYNIYNKSFPKFKTRHEINESLNDQSLKLIKVTLEELLSNKSISFFQIDRLIEIFDNLVYQLYINKNIQFSLMDEKIHEEGNIFDKLYKEYIDELNETKSDDMTLMQLYEAGDDLLNHGSEMISYLIKNQKFDLNKKEQKELQKKENSDLIPLKLSNPKSKEKNEKKYQGLLIKSSKLRMFNYFSYLTTLCSKSTAKFQQEFINLGMEGIKHASYIVHTMVDKLFLVVYENSKKSHRHIQESHSNAFLIRLMKISMAYILGSSENFNQSLQTMYITMTELYSKLSYNLLKIIFLIDDADVYDDELKELAETYTDILLNLFMNCNIKNLDPLYLNSEELKERDGHKRHKSTVAVQPENNKFIQKPEVLLDENDVLITLIIKIKDLFLSENADDILSYKLLKTYSNLMKLACTIVTAVPDLVGEFKKIFHPEKILDFITICVKIIYARYVLEYKFDKENLREYDKEVLNVSDLIFSESQLSELLERYYVDEKIYTDELFILCSNVYIFMNWLNIFGDQDVRKVFKLFEERETNDDQLITKDESVANKPNDEATIEGNDPFEEWTAKLKIATNIKKYKVSSTKIENLNALGFFNYLLKSIDVFTPKVIQEKLYENAVFDRKLDKANDYFNNNKDDDIYQLEQN